MFKLHTHNPESRRHERTFKHCIEAQIRSIDGVLRELEILTKPAEELGVFTSQRAFELSDNVK